MNTEDLYIKPWLSTANIVLGVVSLGLFVAIALKTGRPPTASWIGILILVLGIWQKKNPLIRLHDDHFEMKLAIASSRKYIMYADIIRLEQSSPKKAFLYVDEEGKEKKYKLPLSALSEEDVELLLTRLAQ